MTTESHPPQEHPRESDEPNEFGFAGDATAPQPQDRDPKPGQVDGEGIAVPSGDLTGAVTAAIDDRTDRDRG